MSGTDEKQRCFNRTRQKRRQTLREDGRPVGKTVKIRIRWSCSPGGSTPPRDAAAPKTIDRGTRSVQKRRPRIPARSLPVFRHLRRTTPGNDSGGLQPAARTAPAAEGGPSARSGKRRRRTDETADSRSKRKGDSPGGAISEKEKPHLFRCGFVELPGLEPGTTEPKSAVLPLHHSSILRSKAPQRYEFFYKSQSRVQKIPGTRTPCSDFHYLCNR